MGKMSTRRNGFLLFEALVAILVAGTMLIVLMQGMGNSLKGVRDLENYFTARIMAEGKMALLEKEVSIEPGITGGKFSEDLDPEGIFTWEQKAVPVSAAGFWGTDELPICEVTVTVQWKEKEQKRKVQLATYLNKYDESAPER